jgi:glycosyltransferase involved in cell wall biosynthesis
MTRLLTIGVPTYNRSQSLQLMLEFLSKHIRSFEKELEVIVSDNCSVDSTTEIFSKWAEVQSSDLCIKHIRHSRNIGVSRNLVSLLYAATSDYFLFLGDDDKLNAENFSKVMNLLEKKRPSAVIQVAWKGQIRGGKVGALPFDSALRLFYEYGNAWAGIIDRAAAVKAIESRLLRNEIEEIVWPQTVFGFLAMYDLDSIRPIEAVDFEIGCPLADSLNITNKLYWIRSLTDLLKAAAIVQRSTDNLSLRKNLLNFRSQDFICHIKAIIWNAVIDDDRTSLEAIRKLLRDEFGWRGWLWSGALYIDSHPSLLKLSLKIAYPFMTAGKSKSLKSAIEEARRQRESDILDKRNSGKRIGDWF